MKITTPNFNIECTIDELKAMEQCGILAMICQPEPMPAIPFPLPELPTAGGTNETVAKTDIPNENTPEIATVEVKTEEEPDTTPVTVTFRRKKPKDMERSKQAKAIKRNEKHRWERRKVDVKVAGEWHVFDSVSEAAKFIGCQQNNLSTALNKERETYKGYEIRYHISDNPNQPDLDAVLAEIEERNRQPYECSRPIGH